MNWESLLSLRRFGDKSKRLRIEQNDLRLGFEVDFCATCGTQVASRPRVVDGLTYIPAGFLKNEVDFSPQV